MYHINKYKCYL